MKFYSSIRLKSLGLRFEELEFSFEQIDYLIATPSASFSKEFLQNNKFYIKKLRKSPLSPEIYALKVVGEVPVKDSGQQQNYQQIDIAFLDKKRFPVPVLDMLSYYDEIKSCDYNLIISYLFSHPKTHELIVEEIKKRVVKEEF